MTVKAGPLQAREYQKQLFEKALSSNVIACVETGSGKTLVAALLLEHMYSQEVTRHEQASHPKQRRKISLFLVNLVPLVHQQAAFLDANTSLKIALLYGELEADTGSRSYWNALLDGETAVIVCTARIALNAIIHAYLSLEDVNLIVFDEAHHAIGNNGE
jgi:endoribonuclease Dicer